jgi:hypothetical protein
MSTDPPIDHRARRAANARSRAPRAARAPGRVRSEKTSSAAR